MNAQIPKISIKEPYWISETYNGGGMFKLNFDPMPYRNDVKAEWGGDDYELYLLVNGHRVYNNERANMRISPEVYAVLYGEYCDTFWHCHEFVRNFKQHTVDARQCVEKVARAMDTMEELTVGAQSALLVELWNKSHESD